MDSKYYFLILLFILSRCGKRQEAIQADRPATSELVDNSEQFLNLFIDLNASGLHIYPPSWDKDGKLRSSPLNGQTVDVNKYSYVENEDIFLSIDACRKGLSNIYAVGKFEVEQNTLALLVRQHSQYSESIIDLVFWDKKTRTITKGIDLADSFGDEGWYFDMESWINHTPGSDLEIVTRRKDSNYNDQLNTRTVTDSLVKHVYHFTTFTQDSISKSDTALYLLKRWQ